LARQPFAVEDRDRAVAAAGHRLVAAPVQLEVAVAVLAPVRLEAVLGDVGDERPEPVLVGTLPWTRYSCGMWAIVFANRPGALSTTGRGSKPAGALMAREQSAAVVGL
jgi:hypothetical protein